MYDTCDGDHSDSRAALSRQCEDRYFEEADTERDRLTAASWRSDVTNVQFVFLGYRGTSCSLAIAVTAMAPCKIYWGTTLIHCEDTLRYNAFVAYSAQFCERVPP